MEECQFGHRTAFIGNQFDTIKFHVVTRRRSEMKMNKGFLRFFATTAAICVPSLYGSSMLAATTQTELVLSDGLGDSITCIWNGTGSCTTAGAHATVNAANLTFDGTGGITIFGTHADPVTLGTGALLITISEATGWGCGTLVCPPELANEVSDTADAATGAVLTETYTDTTYTNLTSTLLLSGSNSIANAGSTDTVTFTEYGDNGYAIPATGLIGSLPTLTGPSDNATKSVSNPYTGATSSLTEQTVVDFKTTGGDVFDSTFDVSEPTPVPEPASVVFLGTALLGFTTIVRRRKKINRS
jgi:hypothetical protein